MGQSITRRQFLRVAGTAAAGVVAAACQPKTVLVEVEKEVTKVVKETVMVEGKSVEVTKIVEVEVTAAAPTGPTNALGVTLPLDALPLDQQYRLIQLGRIKTVESADQVTNTAGLLLQCILQYRIVSRLNCFFQQIFR